MSNATNAKTTGTIVLWNASLLVCGFLLACGVLVSEPASAQSVGLNSTTLRSFPQQFYGANGQLRDSEAWDQINPKTGKLFAPNFSAALGGMYYGILRLPAGTQSLYWDWKTGDVVSNYVLTGATPANNQGYLSPLSEFKLEQASASVDTPKETIVDYVLNVMDDPTCVPPQGQQYCSYSSTSPNENYQLQMLSMAAADGINIGYLELGNEIPGAGVGTDKADVYPNGYDYAVAINQWISDIKSLYPSIKTGVPIAGCYGTGGPDSKPCSNNRQGTWDADMMGALSTANDAVIVHNYTASNLPSGSAIDNTTAETLLLVPLTTWDGLTGILFPQATNGDYVPNIWFTEYNLKDSNIQAMGTWAQGLYVATYSLLMASNPRVTVAVHHEVQAGGPDAPDIWANSATNGYSNYGLAIPTAPLGLTAQGLTTRMLDMAAINQTEAEALTFPNGPTFDGTHPKLIGEVFATSVSGNIVILNLDSAPHTVNLSLVITSGTYNQIYGNAGAYVSGATVSDGYQAYDTGSPPVSDNLTQTTGTVNPASVSLPAFSATSIAAQLTAPLTQASQTITFNNVPTQTVGTPLTLTAIANSGLPVSFTSTTTSVCTVSGSTAWFLQAGICSITASQVGNTMYLAAAPVTQTFSAVVAPTVTFMTASFVSGSNTAGYALTITVKNTSTVTAPNVGLSAVTMEADSGTPLPQTWGNLAAGAIATFTVDFPGSVGLDGAGVAEKYTGAYTGGTFSTSIRSVTLP